MFTCPRPGIQIGNCMRSTPGATSVTSSDAGSCSWRGGRASRLRIGHEPQGTAHAVPA